MNLSERLLDSVAFLTYPVSLLDSIEVDVYAGYSVSVWDIIFVLLCLTTVIGFLWRIK